MKRCELQSRQGKSIQVTYCRYYSITVYGKYLVNLPYLTWGLLLGFYALENCTRDVSKVIERHLFFTNKK